MEIGTASPSPGTTAAGWLEVTDLPTGGSERLPVSVAEGTEPGPTLWVTGALHGNEVTGIAAAQDCLTEDVASRLRGTVVSVPILNPAGVRTDQRNSYYNDEDPNRYFPYGAGESSRPPGVQELVDGRVFERFAETADALVSLHEGWITEAPYTIVERVRYGDDRTEAEAADLAERTMALADAFGLPVVREYDVDVQEEYGLQRSFECSAVNQAGVPALTPELGSPHVVEDQHLRAAVTGIRNVLCTLDMLPADPVPNEAAVESPVSYPVKRVDGPVAPEAGIVRHHVDDRDVVEPGTPVADVVTPHGDVKATVEASQHGYVLGPREGIAVYENDVLVSMAARDDGDLLAKRR